MCKYNKQGKCLCRHEEEQETDGASRTSASVQNEAWPGRSMRPATSGTTTPWYNETADETTADGWPKGSMVL